VAAGGRLLKQTSRLPKEVDHDHRYHSIASGFGSAADAGEVSELVDDCGIKPDQPSPNGAITRVVQSIKLYS
jgi:hypothetical protein